jgi:hypothetical protein
LKERKLSEWLSVHFVPQEVGEKYTYNFSVADTRSYRFESNKQSRDAIGYFGDTKDAKRLVDRFNERL